MIRFLLPAFLFFPVLCFAQAYTHVYYLDAALGSTSKEKAVIIGKGFKEDNAFRLDCYYNSEQNLLLSTMHFNDSSLAVFEGEYIDYNIDGKMKERGMYQKNLKAGWWIQWDSAGRKTDSVFYENDTRYKYAKWYYYRDTSNNTRLYSYEITDSLANTFDVKNYGSDGQLVGQVNFIGQTGIRKNYDNGGVTTDTVYTREQREASFPGGNAGWTKYLEKSLGSYYPGDHGAKPGMYRVMVKFMVEKDGSISNIVPETQHGYKMEEKVVKVIQNGPRWIPASQYGRLVKAYRRQPVTFLVESR